MSSFFANKGFHPRMSFDPDDTAYTSTRERLLATKAEDIIDTMKNVLEFVRRNATLARTRMTAQVDKHRKSITYDINDFVFLDRRYIKIARSSDKLDDKKLGPFKVIAKRGTSYELELLSTMRIHSVFHSWLLRKDPQDSLLEQTNESSGPIVLGDNLKWEVDEILNSRTKGRVKRLQYKVKWAG